MTLQKKIAKNVVVQLVGKVISTILGLIAVGIMTRYLGKFGFGEYTTIITFISFFAILADFGITLVTVQMISVPKANEEKIINNIFTFRLVLAAAFLAFAPILIIFFPYEEVIKIGVLIASLSFFFIALNQVFVGLFQKRLRMDKVSIAEVVSRSIFLAGVVLSVQLNYGLIGIIISTVASSLVSFLIHYSYARKYVRLKLEFDKYIWKQIFSNSWPIAITIALNLIYLKTDTLILSLVKEQEDVGIYGAAYKIIDVLITIPFMFAGIMLPILTRSWAEKSFEYFKKVLQKSFDFMVILAIPLVVGAQFLAEGIIIAIAGDQFAESAGVLKILIIACGFIFLGTMFAHAIIAINKQKKVIVAYLFTGITALAGYIIFIPKFSYFGAASITIYSEVVIAIFSIYYIWKYTKFLPSLKTLFKSIIASGIMAAFILSLPNNWHLEPVKLCITLVGAIFIYFISIYLLKGVTKDEVLSFIKK